ncbi:unnamed protein product [Ascophyllum nodosum]
MQVGEAMEGWYFDTGASGYMSPSSEGMINFQPCNKSLRVANGVTLPIEGKGNLVVEFQSGLVRLQLHEVAYVPKLRYHLLSLSKAVEQGHKYIGTKNGVNTMLKSGKKLLVPNVRNMYLTYDYRPESDVEQACAVIAPELLSTTGVDINHYHRTTAHTHPRLLRATAEQQGVKLDPKTKLLPCVGAKGLNALLNKTTECRSDKKIDRIFVNKSGEKPVASKGGKEYSIIFRDDATRMSSIYFMRKKSISPDALKFDEICRKLHIKRELVCRHGPPADGPPVDRQTPQRMRCSQPFGNQIEQMNDHPLRDVARCKTLTDSNPMAPALFLQGKAQAQDRCANQARFLRRSRTESSP